MANTDRELLEWAAKACGELTPSWYGNSDYMDGVLSRWNPLTDDGDALRLAVKLNMGISIPVFRKPRADIVCFRDSSVNIIEEGDDPYAATRRAIVRAAAEIGKAMSLE